ncbi:MAG: nucleoside 2-deoxyribosyltransferase [Bacteroidetes bacterium]|nr:nucleoside 2-deoxyribosyltransferase [Bacteroidota bacterium]
MKIYFAGSIRAGRDDAALYLQLIHHLQQYGKVLTEHVGDEDLKHSGEQGMTDKDIHDRDMDWVLESDVIVAEVTTPSLGVGYEIGRALENGKRILCMYRPRDGKRLSAMIAGSKDISNIRYRSIEEAKQIINLFFE